MNQDISAPYDTRALPETTPPPPLLDLPVEVSVWLHETHGQLALELGRAQSGRTEVTDDEPTVPIDALPDSTRQFLWHAMRRHQPALAALLRDPAVAEIRTTFGAELRLCLDDLLALIVAAARANDDPSIDARATGGA
jgi:hypothetical protein